MRKSMKIAVMLNDDGSEDYVGGERVLLEVVELLSNNSNLECSARPRVARDGPRLTGLPYPHPLSDATIFKRAVNDEIASVIPRIQ